MADDMTDEGGKRGPADLGPREILARVEATPRASAHPHPNSIRMGQAGKTGAFRPRRGAARTEGFAVGSDGTPLYYSLNGPLRDGALPASFSDGIGCDGYVWKYLEPELVKARPIVHMHYRGHGKTPLPRDPQRVTIADCADDLVAVLDAANDNAARRRSGRRRRDPRREGADVRAEAFDQVVLAGHSMGVQVCLETWRRHPERVAGLVLVCGSYGTPLRTFKNSRVLEDLLPLVRLGVHAMPRAIGALVKSALPTQLAYRMATLFEVNGALVHQEDFYPYLEHMSQVDMRLFVDMLSAAGRHTTREILSDVNVPTLIVAGDHDGFTPLALSEEMHALIPGSRLHVVRGGSHTAPIEKPDEVTGVIVEFLSGIERSARPAASTSGAARP